MMIFLGVALVMLFVVMTIHVCDENNYGPW